MSGQSRHIHDGRIIRVEVVPVCLPNGVNIDLDLVRHPGASAVVAETGGEVILIRQYRFAAGGYLWEVPAGTLQAGEAPEACARRELVEEAGVEAGEMVSLGSILTTPGFCDERIHLFLARGLRSRPTRHEVDEVISEVRRVAWAEVARLIERGDLVDAKSLVGLYHAARVLGVSLTT